MYILKHLSVLGSVFMLCAAGAAERISFVSKPMLPSTNAPPFVYAGRLFRIGKDGGIQDSESPKLSLTNDVDRLVNGGKMLINFMCDRGIGNAVKIMKSEDSKYLYYHMKFTNQQESCTIRIDRKSGKATTIKQAEP